MSTPIENLLGIMARLRDPKDGCPWDIDQDFADIAPYTIEEAYEVAEAIYHGDMAALKDELGDLLFQVVFHARMAEEAGDFDFQAVVDAIADKMVRRHPHVFGDAKVADAEAQTAAWEGFKAHERALSPAGGETPSALDGVALALPALVRAEKLQKRAARVGFDWPEKAPVIAKIREELDELAHEIDIDAPDGRIQDEIGDLLFACANLARKTGIDPETALRGTNAKFTRRFKRIEALLEAQGKTPEASSLEEMDALWDQAKAEERT